MKIEEFERIINNGRSKIDESGKKGRDLKSDRSSVYLNGITGNQDTASAHKEGRDEG
jgi:hypothetical protein